MVDMDWAAAMDSEIFREYVKNEVARVKVAEPVNSEDELDVLEQFEEFERDVCSSPKKLAVFRTLQKKFATDPEYAEKCKPEFVNAVMMLRLD